MAENNIRWTLAVVSRISKYLETSSYIFKKICVAKDLSNIICCTGLGLHKKYFEDKSFNLQLSSWHKLIDKEKVLPTENCIYTTPRK